VSDPRQRTGEERSIPALVHGRYLLDLPLGISASAGTSSSSGSSPAESWPLLLGFHGYAENAERCLEQMRLIPGGEGWVLCAVQALHPFYNRANEVVANWMTRADRERAILDNVAYVGRVLAEVRARLPACDRWAFVGFSQGGAMAFRAAAGSPPGARGIVILGSDVPPEINLAGLPPVLLARGDREEWYDAAKLEADLGRLRRGGVEVRPLEYSGGHEWTDEFRAAAGLFLAEVFAP